MGGCATSGKRVATVPKAAAPAAEAPTTPPATVAWVNHQAEKHLVAGIAAFEAKHPDEAQEEFAKALAAFDVPGIDVEGDPSARLAYQKVLWRMSQYDVESLAAITREEIPLEMLGMEFALTQPNPEAESEIRAAMQAISFDLPVQINDDVLAFIEYFRTRHKGAIESGLERGGRYLEMMRKTFRDEGLPQDLVYMALIESNYKPSALSRAKAKGVWQFIPETGHRYGLRQTSFLDERSDPEKATRAAARYLKDLHEMFGDWYLAMAAYNCGEWKIVRELGSSDAKSYWDLVRMNRLREETKNYVPAILAGMIISKNPEAFGFDPDMENPLRYDSVVMPVSIDLRTVARNLDTSADYLRELNPELRKNRTPPSPYALKVPPGRGGSLVQQVLALPPEERGGSVSHTVTKGETLYSIARAYGVPLDELADWNDVGKKAKLRPGAVLQVPVGGSRGTAAPAIAPAVSTTTKIADAGRVKTPEPAASTPAPVRGKRVTYKVKKGDTLYRIARRYNVTVERLAQWNQIKRAEIQPGDVLTIYVD